MSFIEGLKNLLSGNKIELEEELKVVEPEELLEEIKEDLRQDKSEDGTISVEVDGNFSFEVVENKHIIHHRDSTYYILVKYIADTNYLNEKLDTTGRVAIDVKYGRGVRSVKDEEEEVYLYLEKLLNEEKESGYLMERIRKDIEYKIREHEKSKRISEIKNRIAENSKFELKMSFSMKNPK